jgi:hypothetical protein
VAKTAMAIARENDGRPRRANEILRLALLGGLLGLGVGLALLAWSAVRPSSETAVGPSASRGSSTRGPAGTSGHGAGTLGDEAGPAAATTATGAATSESPRATGLRFAWSVKVFENDFEGALEAIEGSGLGKAEHEAQLLELADALIPRSWIDDKKYPVSIDVEAVYRKPKGRDLLARRWATARSTMAALKSTEQSVQVRKVQLLSRMQLFARIFDETPGHVDESVGLNARRPIREVDASGKPLPARPEEKPAKSPPILDYASESRSLGEEARSAFALLAATPTDKSFFHYAWVGWGLLSTCLLSAAGALFTSVGGLLTKSYSELIVRKLPSISSLPEALLGSTGTSADAAPNKMSS